MTFGPKLVSPLLAAAAVAACTTAVPGAGAGGTLDVKPKGDAVAPAPKTRAVEMIVNAPAGLVAAGAGNIVSAGAGNFVSTNGLSLVGAGAGNLVAAGAGNFRLRNAAAGYLPVKGAVVYFAKLDAKGTVFSKSAAKTDADGKVSFKAVADQPLAAVAVFDLDGKQYRLSAAVAGGKQDGATYIDPINTIVEGRIRKILADAGKTDPALALKDLKAVWTVFNDADVAIDLAALERGKTLDDIDAFYQGLIAQLKDEAQKKVVTDYMAKLRAGT